MTTYNGGAEALVNTTIPGDQSDAQVTMLKNGGWVITWTDPNDGNDTGIFQQAYNADGSPLGAQTRVNTLTSGRQLHSEVAATPDGGWIVTYTGWDSNDGGVYKQVYNADGSKNGVETLVNTTTTSTQAGSSISVLADGSYVITWASLLQDGDDGAGIYQQLYSADGSKIGGETAVNTTTAGHQVSPNVAILANGGYVISWTQANGDMISGVVYSQMFDATGAKVGSELSHAVSALGAVDSQVTGLADGGYVVTWITQQSSGSIARGAFAQIYNADGSERGAEITVSSNLGGARNDWSVMQPDVLGLPNGDFIVVWTQSDSSGRGVFGQVYNADGTVDGAAFSITADANFDQMEPQITATKDGGFKVVWRETGVDNYTDIYTRTFSPANNSPSAADATLTTLEDKPYVFKIADFGFSDPDGDALGSVTIDSLPLSGSLTLKGVAVTAGQVIAAGDIGSLVWTPATDANGDGLASFAFTVSDAKGAAAEASHTITFNVTAVVDPIGYEGGAEALVNTTIPGDQSDAQVTMLKNGGWVITWTDPNDGNDAGIFQQAYNADGSPLGAQTQVNTMISRRQIHSEVAATPDGGWIVTYTGWDSDDYGVYKQAYNADGSKNGVETLVNTTTKWAQAGSSISVLANGSYVITWASLLQDGDDGANIYQQLYNADGSKIGGETAVNTTTAGHQVSPNIAILANGGYVVSWTQANGDMISGVVYSQMFDATGAKVGSEHSHAVSALGAVDSQVTGLADGGYVVTWITQQSSGSIARGAFAQVYNADGSERGAEIIVSPNLGGARNDWSVMQPDVLGLPNGDFIVVWTQSDSSGRGVFGQVYNADGTVDGAAFSITADATSDQMEPQITATKDGGFKVVWREVGADNTTDIYTRTFNALYPDTNTAPTGADATLSTLEDEPYRFTTADFGFSDPDGDELGSVRIDDLPGSGSLKLNGVTVTAGQVIAAADIDSLVWTPAIDANGEDLASLTFTVIDSKGKASGSSNTITFDVEEVADPLGYRGGAEALVNTRIPGDQSDAQVTMLSDGGWVITWTDPNDGNDAGIFQQAYNADGTTLGAQTQVNTLTSGRQILSEVAALPDGGWIVTYTGWDSNDYGVYKQAYNADGSRNGVETLVNTTTTWAQARPSISVLADGSYVIAWASHLQDVNDDGAGIYQQLYSADGSKIGGETAVNTTTAGNQVSPNIAVLANGGYVISWTQANGDMTSGVVYSQLFDGTGEKIGSEHSHAVSGKGAVDSQVTGLADGGYVVTWANQQSSGSIATGVFAQAYNADGSERGSEIIVSPNLGGARNDWSVMQPDVLGLPNGDFIVVWTQSDGSGRGVFGQVYNADGTVDGAAFSITADAKSDQLEPQITATKDGGFIVVWREVGADNTTDIYTRTFSPHFAGDNEAPTGTDGVISLKEDQGHSFAAEDFGFSDADGDALASVTIHSVPDSGALTLDGETVEEGAEIAAEDLDKLVWTPAANANGKNLASLEFSVTDDAGSTSEGSYTLSFDVEAVNDAPTSADKTLKTLEDKKVTLSASTFAFNDVDSEMMASVTITVLPENGNLTLNGKAVAKGAVIAASALGGLAWTPAANANGDDLASFEFRVTDSDGAKSEDSYAITFDVAAVNDAPTGANKTVTINEDMSYKLSAANFGFKDIDGDKFSAVKITSLPGSGDLMLSGKAVKLGQTIEAGKLSKLIWTPDENDAGNGLAKIGFKVIDDGGRSNGGVDMDPTENILTINVKEVRDVFVGTSKANKLIGTNFADTLDGKGGKDTLTGKGGADTFVFGDGYGKDTVTDFAVSGKSHDIIDLGASDIDSFKELKADHMAQKGANVLIDLGDGDVLTLLNVKLKALTADHFDF